MIPTSIGRSGKISINLNVALLLTIAFVPKYRLLDNITSNARNLITLQGTSKLMRAVHLTQRLALNPFEKVIDKCLSIFSIV